MVFILFYSLLMHTRLCDGSHCCFLTYLIPCSLQAGAGAGARFGTTKSKTKPMKAKKSLKFGFAGACEGKKMHMRYRSH